MTAQPNPSVVRLYRPTGPTELALVEASGWLAWPPRLPEQPIFYPVLNEWYATKIARVDPAARGRRAADKRFGANGAGRRY